MDIGVAISLFFGYGIYGIHVAYTWRWVFCERAGRRREGNQLLRVLLLDGTRSGEREDGDGIVLDISSPHYLVFSVNYYPPSIIESPFNWSRCTSPAKAHISGGLS